MIYIYFIISIFFILLTKLYLEIKKTEERFIGDIPSNKKQKLKPTSTINRRGQVRRSNLRRSNLRRSNLRRSNLRRSNLRRSNLRRSNSIVGKLYLQKFNIMDSRRYYSLDKPLGPIMPLNSEDYPDFKNNFDVYGSVGKVLNPDLPKKKIVPHFTSLVI